MSTPLRGLALLLWSADPDAPARLATPFMHAAAAAAMDVEVEVYFSARSVELLVPGVAAAIHPGAVRTHSVEHFMTEARSHGAKFYACSASLQAAGIDPGSLAGRVDGFAGASSVIARLAEPGWQVMVF